MPTPIAPLGLPPASARAPLERASRCLFHWRRTDLSLDALTGHAGTLTRTTAGSATDQAGTALTVPHSLPRWDARDTDADSVRETVGLLLGTADALTWPWGGRPRALTAYVELVEAGTRTTSGAGLLYLGNDAATGARFYLDSTGTNYRAVYHDGSSSVTSTLATGTPASGARAELRATLAANGAVQLGLAVGGGAEAVATASSGLALAAAWGTGVRLRANNVGSGGTSGTVVLLTVKLAAGARTLDQMRTLF